MVWPLVHGLGQGNSQVPVCIEETPRLHGKKSIFLRREKGGLESGLSSREHFLLLQRTWVQFPSPSWRPPVSPGPAPGCETLCDTPCTSPGSNTGTHTYTQTCNEKKNKSSKDYTKGEKGEGLESRLGGYSSCRGQESIPSIHVRMVYSHL